MEESHSYKSFKPGNLSFQYGAWYLVISCSLISFNNEVIEYEDFARVFKDRRACQPDEVRYLNVCFLTSYGHTVYYSFYLSSDDTVKYRFGNSSYILLTRPVDTEERDASNS